jgi:HAD superfamily phosphoserine phosphatase-like hydrolase
MNIAFFDFDGTITTSDSLDDFFRYISPNKRIYYKIKYFDTLIPLLLYKTNLISVEKLKLKRLNKFFRLHNHETVLTKAKIFSENIIPNSIKQSAINQIKLHLNNQIDVVIVSASLNILLNNFCYKNKLKLITNNLVFNEYSNKYYFNNIDCNFDEKVNRIRQIYDLSNYSNIYSYGDTNGDLAMLNIANYKYYKYFK